MYERRRNIVARRDGRRVNVARFRGQLFVCATGCCCGRTDDGFAPVPTETFHREWERRRLRNIVHLTIGGCLGPCALANVVLLLWDGQAQWFHSIDSDALAIALYDHVEAMLEADACLPPPTALAPYQFTASAWQPRPDGQPVDDARPWRGAPPHACPEPSGVTADGQSLTVDRVVAAMQGQAALPRKNGELVFEEPWQGRVFGMAVALHERGLFEWEEFRQALIAQIALAEGRSAPFVYYEIWLATFESLLAQKQLVSPAELDETTYQFEFGERDDVF
ncbi:MAG TPA: nitrile hydratase accessory protein [Candidatus Bathyarchaeia archaeon]|nr:nitrile hydratase accessory protein [Candidatus Bathyarchaeia archaeon]